MPFHKRGKEKPELIHTPEIIEIARKDPELFVNCLESANSYLVSNVAMVIQDREHLYRELEYLESAIHTSACARRMPSSGRMHFLYDIALSLSEMVPQFDDIDYEKLIHLQATIIQTAYHYGDRCFRRGNTIHMNVHRMFFLICQNITKAPPEKRYDLINRWLHMADEEMLPFLFSDIMSTLSEADKVKLGKRLAELNMKTMAKSLGWKKRSRKK